MDQLKRNPTFYQIVKLLYRIGMWRDGEESSIRKMARKLFFLLYFTMFLLFLALCAYLTDDSKEFIFLVQLVIIIAVITIKLVYLLWKKDEVLAYLYEGCRELNNDNDKMKKFMKFVNAYIFMLAVAFVFYNTSCLPMFSQDKKLPFFIRFTLTGKYSEILYCLAYVFVGSGIFLCNVFNFITSFIWYTMLNFAIEYEELGNKLRNLCSKKVITKPNREDVGLRDLIILIKAHRNLFE